MWNLPRPGTEPVSLALQGGFFTTELPGNPLSSLNGYTVSLVIVGYL